jgi:hypothetical protein
MAASSLKRISLGFILSFGVALSTFATTSRIGAPISGHTTLVGGAITSTQAAIDHGKNTFQTAGQSAQQALDSGALTLSDIHNQASYSASSSVNLGTGFSPQGKLTPQGTGAGWGKDSGGSVAGAAVAFNIDANNRQLHPTEAQLIKRNAKTYAQRRGITLEQAEAELTQQTLRQKDSAHEARLGSDNPQAQAFLKEIGQGQVMVDPMTGQTYQLFTADEATRNNHAMFGQYAKTSPAVQNALDRAYHQAFKPADARIIMGLNGSNAGALTGSDLALKDAARDYANMRQQPAVVQWAVLGQLRQERAQNLQTQQQLLTELQGMNARSDTSTQARERRTEIINQLTLLEHENQVMREASVEQLKAMGSADITNPAKHREWAEGFGEAIAASRLGLTGMSAVSINARLNMLKGAVEETRAISAAARAEAEAVAKVQTETQALNRIANNPNGPDLTNKPAGQNLPGQQYAVINGEKVKPLTYGTEPNPLYHGADAKSLGLSGMTQEEIAGHILKNGLPGRGTNIDITNHVNGGKDTAFRGATNQYITQERDAGALLWAGGNGVVIKLKDVPGYDVNQPRATSNKGGGIGALVQERTLGGELEVAIPARVKPEQILDVGIVKINKITGRPEVQWIVQGKGKK